MSRVADLIPGLAKRKRLPKIAGTDAVDLAPITRATPILDRGPQTFNVNTGKQSYEARAVAERLESRAAAIQRPLMVQAADIIQRVMKEKMMRVKNDTGTLVEVYLDGQRFLIDPGITEQPRSVALAFEEKKNALLRHKSVMHYGLDGRKGGRPEVEDFRNEIEWRANQDISIR